MKSPLLTSVILLLTAFPPGQTAYAISAGSHPVVKEDKTENTENDSETRINPEISAEDAKVEVDRSSFSKYPFLNLSANHITMNGADWSRIADKLNRAARDEATVSIVHIGDSHVQPDGNTGKLRKIFQSAYGNAGRGLMAPLRIAGTNAPLDYRFTTSAPSTTAKLMRMPWQTQMGFTGVSVHPLVSNASFSVTCRSTFSQLRIYGLGNFEVEGAFSDGAVIPFEWEGTDYGGILNLAKPVTSLQFNIHGQNMTVFGIDARRHHTAVVEKDESRHGENASRNEQDPRHKSDADGHVVNPGVLYHSIGNNGATYSTYSLIGNMGRHLSALHPDLVVISLGTNEAFGNVSDGVMYSQIDHLVSDIRRANPEAQILLTTPSECQRSVYTRVRRGRRRRARRVRSYAVNNNVARIRSVIQRYGRENGIAVYDFYAVAGGKGASTYWLRNRLLSSDRIHRTWTGYYLEGELMAEAMSRALVTAGITNPLNPHFKEAQCPDTPVKSSVTKSTNKKSKAKKTKRSKRRSRSRRR